MLSVTVSGNELDPTSTSEMLSALAHAQKWAGKENVALTVTGKMLHHIGKLSGYEKYKFLYGHVVGDYTTEAFYLMHSSGVLEKLVPELDACFGILQDKRYHKDTVFDHCVGVCKNVSLGDIAYMPECFWADKKFSMFTALRWAGLLHDVGKCQAQEKHGNGSITFHKHEVYSTTQSQKILTRLGVEEDLKNYIVFLISMHMYHYVSEWTDRAVARFCRKAGITKDNASVAPQHPLFILRKADRLSRGLEPTTERQRDFEKRIIEVSCSSKSPM